MSLVVVVGICLHRCGKGGEVNFAYRGDESDDFDVMDGLEVFFCNGTGCDSAWMKG